MWKTYNNKHFVIVIHFFYFSGMAAMCFHTWTFAYNCMENRAFNLKAHTHPSGSPPVTAPGSIPSRLPRVSGPDDPNPRDGRCPAKRRRRIPQVRAAGRRCSIGAKANANGRAEVVDAKKLRQIPGCSAVERFEPREERSSVESVSVYSSSANGWDGNTHNTHKFESLWEELASNC